MTDKSTKTLAAIGCSGPVSKIFVEGFLDRGVKVKLLARDAERAARLYPRAEIVSGSLMNEADVACVCDGVDAAFAVTPMGLRDNPKLEIEAGRKIAEGAKKARLPHLIYTSVLGADALQGVGILDAKYYIERTFRDAGLQRTILRCGSYMEDVFDPRLNLLNKGQFLFPITKERRFSYTSQRDVPRFVSEKLLGRSRVLNTHFNFVSPGDYSVSEVEALLSKVGGFPIKAPAKMPTFYMYLGLLPVFSMMGHRFSSIIPLLQHFDRHGYTSPGATTGDLFPDFAMTSLESHLRSLWAR